MKHNHVPFLYRHTGLAMDLNRGKHIITTTTTTQATDNYNVLCALVARCCCTILHSSLGIKGLCHLGNVNK